MRRTPFPLATLGWTGLFLLGGLCIVPPATAQSTDWTPLLRQDGVAFDFILHRYGDGDNDGVVVRLINTNTYAVDYRFKMIFKTEDQVHISPAVEGRLKPGEVRTGDSAGLWWIPFKDGTAILEVGMKGFKVMPSAPDNGSSPG